MADMVTIPLPLWQLPLLVVLPLVFWAALVFGLRRQVHRRAAPGEERDWSVPPVADGAGDSLFHRWEVRCKIIAILVYSFMVASLTHLASAAVAVAISLVVLVLARTSLTKVLLRLLAIAGFITMFLVVMPLTVPDRAGDTVWVFGGLQWLGFNLRGLKLAGTIAGKAIAVTLLMEPLLSTAPLPVTLHGLARLGVPEVFGQMVLLSYRYLNVFRHEAQRMSSGMQVRGFQKHTDVRTLHAVANFLGMLFVRSFERTERVFDAMRARGYKGRFPAPETSSPKSGDIVLTVAWLALGALLLVLDRRIG